jgi:hypothetical protein
MYYVSTTYKNIHLKYETTSKVRWTDKNFYLAMEPIIKLD